MIDRQPLLRVEHLTKHFLVGRQGLFGRRAGVVHAVDDVSFELGRGEVLGLVGESGCGKSTLGMTIAQLVRRTAGHVYLDGVDLAELGRQELRVHRRKLQVVFQDPYSSLDPRMKVADIIAEPLRVVGLSGRKAVDARVHELLGLVRLNSSFAERYPHELSGGQRQRVGIARALALEPQLIICDEPVSALDASIQAQIVNLLQDLRAELGLSYLFIAHDVSVVAHISDRTAVMYLGRFAELADSAKLVAEPAHPYTRALLAAVPLADPEAESLRTTAIFDGDVPSPVNPPSGCRFRTRCPMAREVCAELLPPLREISKGHHVACHLV